MLKIQWEPMRSAALTAVLVLAVATSAEARPSAARQWVDDQASAEDASAISYRAPRSGRSGQPLTCTGTAPVCAAAQYLESIQCSAGGWGLEAPTCDDSHTITASTALGPLAAFEVTGDASLIEIATKAGDYDVAAYRYGNGEMRLGAFTAYFLDHLSGSTGDSSYRNFAQNGFFDALAAGTYGPDDLSTAGWIGTLEAHVPETLRAWNLQYLAAAAAELGDSDQRELFLDALILGIELLDNRVYYGASVADMLGLAGGVHGLALADVVSFDPLWAPSFTEIEGAATLCELADILAGMQNDDGSWYWTSRLGSFPEEEDKDTQSTAYAVMALAATGEHGCGPYTAAIDAGKAWLVSIQDASGAFPDYSGSGSMQSYVTGEALRALAVESGETGSACAPLPEAASSCRQAQARGSSIIIKDALSNRRDKLRWRWKGEAPDAGDFGDPSDASTDYTLCVYDSSGRSQPLAGMDIPSAGECLGGECWQVGRGFTFRDRNAGVDGINTARFREGRGYTPRLAIRGKGGNLPQGALGSEGLTLPVTVQFTVSDAQGDRCWQAAYSSARRNEGSALNIGTFKAKGP